MRFAEPTVAAARSARLRHAQLVELIERDLLRLHGCARRVANADIVDFVRAQVLAAATDRPGAPRRGRPAHHQRPRAR